MFDATLWLVSFDLDRKALVLNLLYSIDLVNYLVQLPSGASPDSMTVALVLP